MKKDIVQLIFDALREQNVGGAYSALTDPQLDTRLIGEKSVVDSIGLVSLIVDLEEKIADKFGKQVILADERAMSMRQSPFRRVDVLADYIVEKLKEVP